MSDDTPLNMADLSPYDISILPSRSFPDLSPRPSNAIGIPNSIVVAQISDETLAVEVHIVEIIPGRQYSMQAVAGHFYDVSINIFDGAGTLVQGDVTYTATSLNDTPTSPDVDTGVLEPSITYSTNVLTNINAVERLAYQAFHMECTNAGIAVVEIAYHVAGETKVLTTLDVLVTAS